MLGSQWGAAEWAVAEWAAVSVSTSTASAGSFMATGFDMGQQAMSGGFNS